MLKPFILALIGLGLCSGSVMAQCSSYPYPLSNGTTADGSQVMANFNCAALTSGATLTSATLVGGTLVSNTSGNTITLDKPNGAALAFSRSNTQKFLVEDDSSATSSLGFYGWNGTGWNNLMNVNTAGALGVGAAANSNWQIHAVAGGSGTATIYAEQPNNNTMWAAYAANVSGTTALLARWLYQSTGDVGSITTDGSSTSYNTTSDERLKDTTAEQRDYRNAIRALWVGDFRWKKDGSAGFGILAQQAYPLFPEAIRKPATSDGVWEADYGKLAPLALWGTKDLYKVTDRLSAETGDLRAENRKLRAGFETQAREIETLKSELAKLKQASERLTARRVTSIER